MDKDIRNSFVNKIVSEGKSLVFPMIECILCPVWLLPSRLNRWVSLGKIINRKTVLSWRWVLLTNLFRILIYLVHYGQSFVGVSVSVPEVLDKFGREVSILWSYLDITLLFSSYVYLIITRIFWFSKDLYKFIRIENSFSFSLVEFLRFNHIIISGQRSSFHLISAFLFIYLMRNQSFLGIFSFIILYIL